MVLFPRTYTGRILWTVGLRSTTTTTTLMKITTVSRGQFHFLSSFSASLDRSLSSSSHHNGSLLSLSVPSFTQSTVVLDSLKLQRLEWRALQLHLQLQRRSVSSSSYPSRYFSTSTTTPTHEDEDDDNNLGSALKKRSKMSSSSGSVFHHGGNNRSLNPELDPLEAFKQRREAAAAVKRQQQQQGTPNNNHPRRPWEMNASKSQSNNSNWRSKNDLGDRAGSNTSRHRQNQSSAWSNSRPRSNERGAGGGSHEAHTLKTDSGGRRPVDDNGNRTSPSFFDRREDRPRDNNRRSQLETNLSGEHSNQSSYSGKNNNRNNTATRGTSILTDLIRQMKQDGTGSPSAATNAPVSSESPSDTRQLSRPSWRDSFHRKFNPNTKSKGSLERGRKPFGQDQSSRSPQPSSEDFLLGRLSRSDGTENEAKNSASAPSSSLSSSRRDQSDNVGAVSTPKTITLPATSLTVAETSALFRIRVDDIQKKLVDIGLIPSPSRAKRRQDEDDGSQSSSPSPSTDDFMLDVDALELLGLEYGIDTVRSAVDDFVFADSKRLLMQQRRSDEKLGLADSSQAQVLRSRPPVVSVMGHVDHGKTTLMDALRRRSQKKLPGGKTKPNSKMSKKQQKESGGSKSGDVAGTEAGGITQVISAFQVAVEGYDDMITFLDTPGHAAFSAMRQSGSHAADVIVLVIAADDGVSPQTVEILNMFKSIAQGSSDSGISMVVALNKIDKPGIDVDEAKRRIENQLLEHGIVPEGMDTGDSEFGQPVQVIPTSGLTGLGLDDLIEGLMLQSEIMDLRADNEAPGEGIVMDARIEKGLGVVADCIIRLGKIESGSFIMSGDQVARVRMLKDVNDKTLKTGLPSQPVRIVGFRELPKAGDPIVVVDSEEAGEEILRQRLALNSSGENLTSDRPDGERSDLSLQIHGMRRGDSWRVKKVHEKAGIEAGGDSTRIPVIVKADADGSLSAIRDSLLKLADNSTKHNVIIDPVSEGIGEITMSDIQLAKESDATIFAFGLSRRIDQATLNLAESEGVKICSNDIIYALLDEAKEVLGRHLPPTPKEHVHGRALVQAVFMIDTPEGKEQVAGLKVTDGHIYKDKAKLRTTEAQILLDCAFRVYRDGEQIAPGLNEASSSRKDAVLKASSLRKFKELVDSVRMGEECGLALSGYSEFQEGDEIDCYSIEMKPTKL